MTISTSSKQFVANASKAQLMQMLQTTYCPAYGSRYPHHGRGSQKRMCRSRCFMGSRYSHDDSHRNADNQPTYRGLQHSLLFTADIAENGGIDYLDRPAFIAFCDALGFPPASYRVTPVEVDRINNELGYSPDNIRWATKQANLWNRSGIMTSIAGIEAPRRMFDQMIQRNRVYSKDLTIARVGSRMLNDRVSAAGIASVSDELVAYLLCHGLSLINAALSGLVVEGYEGNLLLSEDAQWTSTEYSGSRQGWSRYEQDGRTVLEIIRG